MMVWVVDGRNFGCIYDATSAASLKNAYDHGHQVASHTWSHKDLTTLSDAQGMSTSLSRNNSLDADACAAEQEFSKVNGVWTDCWKKVEDLTMH